jgi:hypothetical protein
VGTDAPIYQNVVEVLPLTLMGLALLIIPGLALLKWAVPSGRLSLAARLSLAPGVSMALGSLVVIWLSLAGIRSGLWTPWIITGAAAAWLVYAFRRTRRHVFQTWAPAAALAAFALVVFWQRAQLTQGLWVPAGVDSAHHTLIARLIVEHGGMFTSWEPYESASTFTYHAGFHVVAALLSWMSGADPVLSVMVMSRLLVVSACLGLFGLTQLWTRSFFAGLVAACLFQGTFGDLGFFEMYGRWTMLSGLTALSSALALLWIVLTSRSRPVLLRGACSLALTAGGLFVIQYKSSLFFVVIGGMMVSGAALTFLAGSEWRAHMKRLLRVSLWLGCAGFVSLALAAPRLVPALAGRPGDQMKKSVGVAASQRAIGYDTRRTPPGELFTNSVDTNKKKAGILLALAGAGLSILMRRGAAFYFFGWVAMSLFVNPHWIGIDRVGPVDEGHWRNALTTTFCVMSGMAVGLGLELVRASRILTRIGQFAACAGCIAVTFAGKGSPLPASSLFVGRDDRAAMEWLREHAKPGERVAGAVFIKDGVTHSVDALLWLSYFTGLRTNHTLYALVLETGMPERHDRLEFSRSMIERDMRTRDSAEWLVAQGYRWVLAGSLASPDLPLLQQLATSPWYEVAFRTGRTAIYRPVGSARPPETLSTERPPR